MNEIPNYFNSVYIFENTLARRVKVGTTSTGLIFRLDDLNDIWSGRKVTCQICGGRLMHVHGKVPPHVVSGIRCLGGNALPIEKEVRLAENYLIEMKNQVNELFCDKKNSLVRKINNIEKRIKLFRNFNNPIGIWKFKIVYFTKYADKVESLSHEILSEYLDKLAPIGEIFICSVLEASKAVEEAFNKLNLLQSSVNDHLQSRWPESGL